MKAPQDLSNLLTEPHIYTSGGQRKLELGYVLLVVIAFLAMAVLSLVLKRDIGSFLVGVVGTLCFVVFGFVLSHTTKQNFFITGREGIIFTRPGITIFSPWKNIFHYYSRAIPGARAN